MRPRTMNASLSARMRSALGRSGSGYLIDLGKKLPSLPDAEKTEANRVHGCQAMVWMIMEP